MEAALVLARLGQYVGAAGLFGGAVLLARQFQDPALGERRFLLGSTVLLFGATFAAMDLQAAIMAGQSGPWSDPSTVAMVLTQTSFGWAVMIRLVAVGLAFGALAFTRPRTGLRLAAGVGAVATATLGWGGHGVADEGVAGDVHLAADIVHLLAAALWIGALAMLVVMAVHRQGRRRPAATRRLHDALAAFSGLGSVAVAMLIVTGLVNSWFLIGPARLPALVTTLYGRLLLAKLALFGGMIALAAANRWRQTGPGTASSMAAAQRRAGARGRGRRPVPGGVARKPCTTHGGLTPPGRPPRAAEVNIMLQALLHALAMAATMGWEILWALVFGFMISGAIQAVVSHKEMARLLPDDGPRSIAKATALGAASSSCSYAAVAIARSMVRKDADFTAAMAFQFASTNLVLELGLILAILMGWRFTAATWAGGLVMIVLLVVLMRLVFRRATVAAAKAQADKGVAGKMEGHAAMDMSVDEGSLRQRLVSGKGLTATAHYYWMDWASLWFDIALGLLIAGAVAAWVPSDVWARVFAVHDPTVSKIVGPLIGPLIAVVTFVCSVGNVPLAAVLWQGGASFGGVIAFIFGDLIVLPILDIYRRYYGLKVAALLGVVFYVAMAGAAYVIEVAFGLLHLIPSGRTAHVMTEGISWNYTTWLDLAGLALSALLLWRFLTTGGPEMLRMMKADPNAKGHGDHAHHH